MTGPVFVSNAWYVAAEPEELVDHLCARTILNRRIVLFRTDSGKVVALDDRCPHRYAPLSKGRIEGEIIRCGYHGACFDENGYCVSIPGQDKVSTSPVLKSYPLIEKYGYIWIWPGAPKEADKGESIPEGFYIGDDPAWRGRKENILSLRGYYELINDNLFDVTHAEWVHGSTLGAELMRLSRKMVKGLPDEKFNGSYYHITDKSVRFGLHSNNGMSPPAFSKGLAMKYNKDAWNENTDWHLDVEWWFPTYFVFDVKTRPAGARYEDGVRQVSLNALTPETETTTHYFFTVSHNYDLEDESVTDYWAKGVSHAFHEDEVIISAQQERILDLGSHDLHELPKMTFSGDTLGMHARRLIRKRQKAEQRGEQ
jgi:vanillate O-demethylase monooxygenase subunit